MTKKEAARRACALRELAATVKLPKVPFVRAPVYPQTHLLNQYTLTDLHLGMLAWGEETGGSDYDLKLAEQLITDWIAAGIRMSPKADVAVLALLGDFMHHDSHESVTPASKHALDADSRLQKIIRVALRVQAHLITSLRRKYKRVHIIDADANHDPAGSAWRREHLSDKYAGVPGVTVDASANTYYAYQWGKTGLFYHHGHKQKINAVDRTLAGHFGSIFGATTKRYAHIGHLHSDAVVETNLMKVERHRTLAPADAYSAKGGWMSGRDAKVITYDDRYGEVFRTTLCPELVQA